MIPCGRQPFNAQVCMRADVDISFFSYLVFFWHFNFSMLTFNEKVKSKTQQQDQSCHSSCVKLSSTMSQT